MPQNFPSSPVKVTEIQGWIHRNGLDCSKNSRQILEHIESDFGCKVKLGNLVLAVLWTGFAVIPNSRGSVFRFMQVDL